VILAEHRRRNDEIDHQRQFVYVDVPTVLDVH
jgi:hypothetical protein